MDSFYRCISTLKRTFLGLNVGTPSQFRKETDVKSEESPLPQQIAAYFAVAIKHRADLTRYATQATAGYALTILLWLLAMDLLEAIAATEANPCSLDTWGAGRATFHEQMEYYKKQDFHISQLLSSHITENLLKYDEYFEESMWLPNHFINTAGVNKLRKDCSDICRAVGIK
jgi:hypothetical protein